MAFEELKAKKKELGYSNKYISEKTGLPIGTIQKFFSGATKAPRRETIKLIEDLLMIPEKQTSTEDDLKEMEGFEYLKEMRWKACRGELSLNEESDEKDYRDCLLAVTEGKKGIPEVIDGKLYEMAENTMEHSLMVGEIMIRLDSYIEAKRKRDLVIIDPVDVFLDKDARTVVHPDIAVLRNRFMFDRGMIFGAPDFIIEVVTPESRKKDTIIKYYRYAMAGVKEYWTVDLRGQYVTVYDMEQLEMKVYSFKDEIPIGIWNNEFCLDFASITENL